MADLIFSYREMCDAEKVQTLQRGMNFRLNPSYSVILMSRRRNAPYKDSILDDGITIEYEGHDEPKTTHDFNPKYFDQPIKTERGTLTQNGQFVEAVKNYKLGRKQAELVKVYEKILSGMWSLKGYFQLRDYRFENDGKRNVYIFILVLSNENDIDLTSNEGFMSSRLIPSEIKKEVWQRDKGKCVKCNSTHNLHFDHDIPFSKGGTSLTAKNVRILCMNCNLSKSAKIE